MSNPEVSQNKKKFSRVEPTIEEAMAILTLDEIVSDEAPLDLQTITGMFENLLKKRTIKERTLVDAKNVLVRENILQMMRERGYFTIPEKIFGEETCGACNGTGERYWFHVYSTNVKCRCDNGVIREPCKSCGATGWYRPGVKCNRCKDGVFERKCTTCRGKGTYPKLLKDASLKSTTWCKSCRGRGFKPPVKAPDNPVIDTEKAHALAQMIKSEPVTEDVSEIPESPTTDSTDNSSDEASV